MHMIRVMSPDSGVCFCYCCCLVDACPIFLAPFKKNSPIHFVPFSKSIFQYMYMDIFLDSVLFHCSKYLSFCQYHILDYHALFFKIEQCESSNFVLIFQNYFVYSSSFAFPCNFRIILITPPKSPAGILIEITMNLC